MQSPGRGQVSNVSPPSGACTLKHTDDRPKEEHSEAHKSWSTSLSLQGQSNDYRRPICSHPAALWCIKISSEKNKATPGWMKGTQSITLVLNSVPREVLKQVWEVVRHGFIVLATTQGKVGWLGRDDCVYMGCMCGSLGEFEKALLPAPPQRLWFTWFREGEELVHWDLWISPKWSWGAAQLQNHWEILFPAPSRSRFCDTHTHIHTHSRLCSCNSQLCIRRIKY